MIWTKDWEKEKVLTTLCVRSGLDLFLQVWKILDKNEF